MRIFKAIVLLDEVAGPHYATWVEQRRKTIETRMRLFKYSGDIVICCGASSRTSNSGKALCIVRMAPGRPMTTEDEKGACIEAIPGRYAYDLSEWRFFAPKFPFARRRVSGTFQGIFEVAVPDHVEITV